MGGLNVNGGYISSLADTIDFIFLAIHGAKYLGVVSVHFDKCSGRNCSKAICTLMFISGCAPLRNPENFDSEYVLAFKKANMQHKENSIHKVERFIPFVVTGMKVVLLSKLCLLLFGKSGSSVHANFSVDLSPSYRAQ